MGALKRPVLVAVLLAAGCIGESTGPGQRGGGLAFVPTFQTSAAALVAFDRVRITLLRPGASRPALDTVIAIPPAVDSVDISLRVPLNAASETMLLYLRLVNAAGDTVFRNSPYPQPVTVTSGSRTAAVETLLSYVGVGANAVALVIATPDTVVTFGQELLLGATALDAGQQPIPGTPIEWISEDPLRVVVPDRAVGRVLGGAQRGGTRVIGRLLTGPADTILVTAQPLPAALTIVNGDNQTAPPGTMLPLPLRVRVTAADGLGVRVPVRFRALVAGATVVDTLVASDDAGYAETFATLGAAAGAQMFEASIVGGGLPPAAFTMQAGSVLIPAVLFAGDSLGLQRGVFRVNPDGSGRLALDSRAGIGDVHPRWSPDRGRVAFTFAAAGPNALYIVADTGGPPATPIADSSARRPRWSPDGRRLAFECGDAISLEQDVCVLPDVSGPIASLSGLEGQRVWVTDFDPTKRNGPAAFAWDPADSRYLVVVRDSADGQGNPLSRLYRVSFDGLSADTLSAALADPQSRLPLRVVGTLDWSGDGATIVFAAVDPLGASRRLYVIGRDGTGLRELTKAPGFASQPVLSPDGRQVLYLRDGGCSVDYWVVRVADGVERRLSDEQFCDITNVIRLGHDWSADGKDIVLVGAEQPGGFLDLQVFRMPAGTTDATYRANRVVIGRRGPVFDGQPSWRP